MKHDDTYRNWIQAKRETVVRPDFADRVMQQIEPESAHLRRSILPEAQWVERPGLSAWLRIAAVILASVLGFGRILLTLHVLLSV